VNLTERQQYIGLSAALIVLIGFATLIPLIGLFIGPLVKGFAGLVGGAVGAYLLVSNGRAGIRLGAIIGVVGGVASGLVNFVLNAFVVTAIGAAGESGAAGGLASGLFLGVIGLLTGWIFVVVGALIGGGAVGWLFGDQRSTDTTEMLT
jgi:hypothetical protein